MDAFLRKVVEDRERESRELELLRAMAPSAPKGGIAEAEAARIDTAGVRWALRPTRGWRVQGLQNGVKNG